MLRSSAPLGLLVAAAVILPAKIAAQEHDWLEVRSARQIGSIEAIDAEIHYGVGELTVAPARELFLYEAALRYDAAQFEPLREWTVENGRAHLRFGLDEFDVDLDDLSEQFDETGTLHFAVSREVPTNLSLEMGAVSADLDLGGAALTGLTVRTGASETTIRFDAPNPETMDKMVFKVGAAEFEARELGNANFRHLSFEGGVGEVMLDLTGEWKESADIEIKMGLGALELRLPRDVGVRVTKKTFLAAFDRGGLQKVDGAYVSSNWDSADVQLNIDLKATLGAIEINFAR
ncbi:MAG: hypothetical protein ABFS14_02075 [Gemmatimonadota bacterium]